MLRQHSHNIVATLQFGRIGATIVTSSTHYCGNITTTCSLVGLQHWYNVHKGCLNIVILLQFGRMSNWAPALVQHCYDVEATLPQYCHNIVILVEIQHSCSVVWMSTPRCCDVYKYPQNLFLFLFYSNHHSQYVLIIKSTLNTEMSHVVNEEEPKAGGIIHGRPHRCYLNI